MDNNLRHIFSTHLFSKYVFFHNPVTHILFNYCPMGIFLHKRKEFSLSSQTLTTYKPSKCCTVNSSKRENFVQMCGFQSRNLQVILLSDRIQFQIEIKELNVNIKVWIDYSSLKESLLLNLLIEVINKTFN